MALIFCPVTQNMSFPRRTINWPAARTPPLPCTPRMFLLNMKKSPSPRAADTPACGSAAHKAFYPFPCTADISAFGEKTASSRSPYPPCAREANFFCSGGRNRSAACVLAISGICSRCEAARANFARRTFSAANKVCPEMISRPAFFDRQVPFAHIPFLAPALFLFNA